MGVDALYSKNNIDAESLTDNHQSRLFVSYSLKRLKALPATNNYNNTSKGEKTFFEVEFFVILKHGKTIQRY